MRQAHLGGDKLFVDYAGDTVPVMIDARTGKVRRAHLFVAVMGGSSLSFAHASWTETLGDWIDAHVQAFAFFGGAPRLLVPDNPKVAVIKACFYDPQVNRTYAEMAAHYNTAVLPARPRRPRDKAKVEALVRIVERWLLGKLRHRRFTSLAEVNAAIAELLTHLNERRVMRHIGRTRRQLFDEIDAPRLGRLPAEPYALAEWRLRKVGLDYHVDFDGHFYSAPYRHARASVEVRATLRTIEIFLKGERIAAHVRGSGDGKHTTIPEHMPSSHRRYLGWSIERILAEARSIGPSAELLCQMILERRPHPEQGFRSCLGIVRLLKAFGQARLEAACLRALEVNALSYGSVKSILDNRLDGQPVHQRRDDHDPSAVPHPNIRGPRYYH
jgi:transposase